MVCWGTDAIQPGKVAYVGCFYRFLQFYYNFHEVLNWSFPIEKDGRVSGGLKYQEGRLVVVGDVIRAVKKLRDDDTLTDSVRALLDQAAANWSAQLERYQTTNPGAMTWIAYSQGGVDAVAEVRRALLPPASA